MAGRGTDIVLGGNPEILLDAKLQAQGLDPLEDSERYQEAWDEQLPAAKERSQQLGDEVREAGGLYVIGTERHESRRIETSCAAAPAARAIRASPASTCPCATS